MEKREITGVQGQVNNIEVIFKEYYGSLCYFASQFLKNEEVIEDLVQDVFIALLEKKMLFQSEVHLKNFLYLSIRNSCLNYIRSTRSKDRYIASLAHEEQTEDFEESIILAEIHRELAAAVEKLPEECRKVFQLCYFQGLDNESAAQELGLSVNTVRKFERYFPFINVTKSLVLRDKCGVWKLGVGVNCIFFEKNAIPFNPFEVGLCNNNV